MGRKQRLHLTEAMAGLSDPAVTWYRAKAFYRLNQFKESYQEILRLIRITQPDVKPYALAAAARIERAGKIPRSPLVKDTLERMNVTMEKIESQDPRQLWAWERKNLFSPEETNSDLYNPFWDSHNTTAVDRQTIDSTYGRGRR
jgi:hypothetical protein